MTSAAVSIAAGHDGAPWHGEPPSLDALERGEGTVSERALYRTLHMVEDVWATAAGAGEPDAGDVQVRIRPLLEAVATHVASGWSRLPLDDLQRAARFLNGSLRSIVARPNTRLARTHQPVAWARLEELDARSLAWMSRLPGRTMREKSSTTAHALGVVRTQSLEVAENRALARMVRELWPLVECRLRATPSLDLVNVDARHQDLRALGDWFVHEWPPSALARVRPAMRPEPNNALLGSGHYGRVWRTLRWLAHRGERFAAVWRGGAELLQRALALLLAARFAARADAFVVDDLATVRLDGSAQLLGLVAAPSLDIVIADVRPCAVSIQNTAGQPLRVVGRDAVSGEVCISLELEVAFDPPRLDPGRGCPVNLAWIDVDRGVIGDTSGWFDVDGVPALLDAIEAKIVSEPPAAPRVLLAGARCVDLVSGGLRLVAVDLAASTPLLAADDGVVAHRPTAAVIGVEAGTEHVQRVLGDDALAVRRERAAAASSFFLAEKWATVAAGTAPVTDLADALRPLVPVDIDPDCALCIPVPDGIGEPGEALLRAALPSELKHAWLIPRAAAAVLALRAESVDAVAIGDSALVLDCGPLGFEARLLSLRADPSAVGEDPFFWDCPLPWPERPESAAGASRRFWSDVAKHAIGLDVAAEYVERVVNSGLVARVATDPEGRPGAVVTTGSGQIGPQLRVSPDMLGPAVLDFDTRFRTWLASLQAGGVLADAAAHAGGGRLHVLAIGEPLVVPAVAEALRAECAARLPDAVLHVVSSSTFVVRGGLAFLRRQRDGKPTFEVALPDLFMKVERGGVATSIPIFEGRRVRPGAVIAVPPLPFELTAGVERIALPLEREPGGRRPMSYRAVLEGDGLPLAAPLRVDLHVSYRYAEDGFRIRIRPRHLDATTAAFEEREVSWKRADAQSSPRRLVNEPPQIPAPRELSLADAQRALTRAQQLWSRFDRVLSEHATRAGKRAPGLGQGVLDQETRDLIRELNEVGKDVGSALSAGAIDQFTPTLMKAISACWVGPLALLVDCRPAPYERPPALRWAPKAGDLRKSLRRLVEAAERALTRLGRNAPPDLAQRLLRDLVEERRWGDCVVDLGRAFLSLPTPARIKGVQWLLRTAGGRGAEVAPWWALATVFWGDTTLVAQLAVDDIERLLARIDGMLVATPPPPVALFDEVAIVLMAVLLRRGQPDAGPIHAGEPRLERLADRIEEIDRQLFATGRRREPRLKLAGAGQGRSDVSVFVDSLAAALRGERVALIRMLED